MCPARHRRRVDLSRSRTAVQDHTRAREPICPGSPDSSHALVETNAATNTTPLLWLARPGLRSGPRGAPPTIPRKPRWRRSPLPRCPMSSCSLADTASRSSARALSAWLPSYFIDEQTGCPRQWRQLGRGVGRFIRTHVRAAVRHGPATRPRLHRHRNRSRRTGSPSLLAQLLRIVAAVGRTKRRIPSTRGRAAPTQCITLPPERSEPHEVVPGSVACAGRGRGRQLTNLRMSGQTTQEVFP
jgi:hypothetical protein